jgi:hypothetical protein
LASEASAGNEKKVISSDHGYGDQGAGGAASATGLGTYWHGDERENQTSERKCQAAVKLDARF